METSGFIPKLCCICSQDIAGKKRTKDQQGNYYCAPCFIKRYTPSEPISKPLPQMPAVSPPVGRSRGKAIFIICTLISVCIFVFCAYEVAISWDIVHDYNERISAAYSRAGYYRSDWEQTVAKIDAGRLINTHVEELNKEQPIYIGVGIIALISAIGFSIAALQPTQAGLLRFARKLVGSGPGQ